MPLFEVTARDRKIYEEEIRDFLLTKSSYPRAHLAGKPHPPSHWQRVKPAHRPWPSLCA